MHNRSSLSLPLFHSGRIKIHAQIVDVSSFFKVIGEYTTKTADAKNDKLKFSSFVCEVFILSKSITVVLRFSSTYRMSLFLICKIGIILVFCYGQANLNIRIHCFEVNTLALW
jgi:hypothetical protein